MNVLESAVGGCGIDPKRLYELHESGKPIELIDVRTPAEYRSLHATIARLVPLDELNPKTFMETRQGAKDAPIYVICRSGTRGEKSREKFFAAGFADVVNVTRGTLAWERSRPAGRTGQGDSPAGPTGADHGGDDSLGRVLAGRDRQRELVPARGVRRLRAGLRGPHRLLPAGVGGRQDALEPGGKGSMTPGGA